jgi:hypothetical protein
MSLFWRRVLIIGGFVVGAAMVALLAVIAYALLSEDDGGPAVQVAQPTATSTPRPVVTRTPLATPTPTPPPPPPTQTAEPTPEATEEPPPPAPVEEQPPPAQEQPAIPPPTEEAPPPTEEPPPATQPPSPAPPTEAPSYELPEYLVAFAEACLAWIDAGAPPADTGGWAACQVIADDVCAAWERGVPGTAEDCSLLRSVQPSYPAPSSTGGEIVVETCIDGDFEGWEGDTVFELCNGQVWQQASYDYTYHYAYRPDVTIVSTGEGYRMFVEGVSDSILVSQVTDFIRTCIDGEFEGWKGNTVFVLCNGQVWQQASPGLLLHLALRPDVLIYRADSTYRMKVEGVQDTIKVIRLQ